MSDASVSANSGPDKTLCPDCGEHEALPDGKCFVCGMKDIDTTQCPACKRRGVYVCVNMTFKKCIVCHYSLGAPV